MSLVADKQAEESIWRQEQLEDAGFPRWDAFRLAESGADYRRAIKMLAQGCPPPLVVEILV